MGCFVSIIILRGWGKGGMLMGKVVTGMALDMVGRLAKLAGLAAEGTVGKKEN